MAILLTFALMYKILRRFLFLFDPEKVHYFSMESLRTLCRVGIFKQAFQKYLQPATTPPTNLFGLSFKNKVGLGAGFDKNALYLDELEAMGFGAVEIGTVTPVGQHGSEKPRLFRLTGDQALVNRMGFNNDGVEMIAERLKTWRLTNKTTSLIIGGNIGKNKVTPNDEAWCDYEKSFTLLHEWVDYFVVNVSSPNTPGLRELQEKDALHKILTNLQQLNKGMASGIKPILLKIAPDLSFEQVDVIITLAAEINLDGLVVSNTTIDRSALSAKSKDKIDKIGAGGLSGKPIRKRSTELVQYISGKTNGTLPIIASGGIFTAADANEKLSAGASLIQVWTGFIYEGPAIVKKISDNLVTYPGS